MKLLKKGRNVSRIITCKYCDSKIKYQPGEVQMGKDEIYNVPAECRRCNGGRYDPVEIREYYYIICPNCKMEVTV